MTTLSDDIDSRLGRLFTACARIAALGVACVGMIIVWSHVSDRFELDFGSGGVGLSFALAGAALFCLLATPRWQRAGYALGYLGATLVTALSLLNLSRYFMGLELADTLSNLAIGDFDCARLIAMSPTDSIETSLIGVSLLLLPVSIHKVRPSEILTFSATIISVMTLLGVILHIDTFCVFISCARISIVGGLTFALLCLGTLLARPTEGFMSLMVSKHAGGMMARRLIPTALVVPVIFSWTRMQMQEAGLNDEVSLTIMIASMVIFFSLILWWNAWSLDQMDKVRQTAMDRLGQSERRTRTIIQQAIDAFIAFDAQGVIKDWNERAEYTFGWTKDEAIGHSLFDLIVPQRSVPGAKLALEKHLGAPRVPASARKPVETMARHKDEHEFPVEISLFPVSVDGEQMMCGFVRDITERKEVQQRFNEFYSTVSHELRSPLTSIRGSIDLIKHVTAGKLEEAVRDMLDIADNSLDRLIRLINELLDIKRIEEGHLNLEYQPLDPITILKLSVDGLHAMALKSKVELLPVIEAPSIFSADADCIVRVLTNLIANAIKFSPKDSVVMIRVSKSLNPHRLRFTVEDQGPGIPPAELHKLFSKFGQLADGRKQLGSGLGLAISKALVEQHGGEIGIDSKVGVGTTFWFELPLSPQATAVEKAQMTTIKIDAIDDKTIEAYKAASLDASVPKVKERESVGD